MQARETSQPTSSKLDEWLFRLSDALRMGRLSEWESNFVKSVLGQARRRRNRWSPTGKQITSIRSIISGLATPVDSLISDASLIDHGDHDAAA